MAVALKVRGQEGDLVDGFLGLIRIRNGWMIVSSERELNLR